MIKYVVIQDVLFLKTAIYFNKSCIAARIKISVKKQLTHT